jgi:outer membrane protein TolC
VRRLRALAVAAFGVTLGAALALALGGAPAAAQPPRSAALPAVPPRAAPPRDSTGVLTFDEFARRVAAAHPVARQARLARDGAREELRAARGAFDPTVSAAVDRKTFLGTAYYNYAEAELKLPTPVRQRRQARLRARARPLHRRRPPHG